MTKQTRMNRFVATA